MAESAKRMWSPDEFDDSSAKKICLAEDVKHDVDAPIEIALAATPEVSTVEVSTAEISAVEDFSVEDSAVEDSTMEVQTPDVSNVEVSTAELSGVEGSTVEDPTMEVQTPDVSIVEDSTVEVSTIDLSTEESNMNLTVESIDLTKPLELPTRPPRRKASMVDKTQKVVKKYRPPIILFNKSKAQKGNKTSTPKIPRSELAKIRREKKLAEKKPAKKTSKKVQPVAIIDICGDKPVETLLIDSDDDDLPLNQSLRSLSIHDRQLIIPTAIIMDFMCRHSPLMKIALENAQLNGLNNLPLMGEEAFKKVQKYEDVLRAQTIDLTMDYSARPAILDNEDHVEIIDNRPLVPIDYNPVVDYPTTALMPVLAPIPPNECGEVSNLQFPKKIWYIVNNPFYHCMFWSGRGCDADVRAENGHGDAPGSTTFVINKKWVLQPGQVLDVNNQTLFTTSNYQSLIRQLNLYGFRKVKRSAEDPTYAQFRRNVSRIIDPLTSRPSQSGEFDEFRHTFFRENREHKVKFIKRQKPFKPTKSVCDPPVFTKGFSTSAEPVRRSLAPIPISDKDSECESDTYSDDYQFADDEVIDLARMAMSGETVYNPLGDGNFELEEEDNGDDPEAAFGPKGASS